ncbi:hypothetical protein PQX77_005618 [Marasmius sp. AFHP31]|nr:hypothetical protein PQX77_005618 [Marasmius sp. AFHP31]
MPGPSNANSKKKRKSQGKNGSRHQRKSSGASSTTRASLSVKEVEVALEDIVKSAQREKNSDGGWRKSIGSDSTETSGLRTPSSPDLPHTHRGSGHTNGEPGDVELTSSKPVETENDALREGPHIDIPLDDIPLERTTAPAFSEDIFAEPSYTPGKYDHILLSEPCIHDSGNGPRVINTREFLNSRFFAQPPALGDPLRAEFAQEEVLQMLKTVLPEEMALILWYNKSRPTSRICPACHRLYHVGDVLPDAIDTTTGTTVPPQPSVGMHPQLEREQDISGLCSSICFILASVAQCDPISIKSAWGHTADEIDDKSWSQISTSSAIGSPGFQELTMVLRMTRLGDLGLGQLCFPDLDLEGPPEEEEVP